MTQVQRNQIIKTLHFVGCAAVAVIVGLTIYGTIYGGPENATIPSKLGGTIRAMVIPSEAGFIFYPALGAAVVSFWTKSFIKAGSKGKQD
jgi:hypothetical protein